MESIIGTISWVSQILKLGENCTLNAQFICELSLAGVIVLSLLVQESVILDDHDKLS